MGTLLLLWHPARVDRAPAPMMAGRVARRVAQFRYRDALVAALRAAYPSETVEAQAWASDDTPLVSRYDAEGSGDHRGATRIAKRASVSALADDRVWRQDNRPTYALDARLRAASEEDAR